MEKKKMQLDIINPNCAGIDIGSKSHYVAVGHPRRRRGVWRLC